MRGKGWQTVPNLFLLIIIEPEGSGEGKEASIVQLVVSVDGISSIILNVLFLDMILEMLMSECSHYFFLITWTSRAHRVNNRASWGGEFSPLKPAWTRELILWRGGQTSRMQAAAQ